MKVFKWVLFLLLLFILSYFREMLFLGINEITDQNFNHNPYSYKPDFLKSKPSNYLINLKFVFTAGFSILFALLTVLGLKFSFSSKFPSTFALFSYLTVFLMGGISTILSKMLGGFDILYPYLRELIGYIHNPVFYILISVTVLATQSLKDYK